MPDEPITIREGTDADAPAVLELLKSSLGEGAVPRTPEFWAWKHRDNPFGRSPFWLAESGSELAGVRVFLRWRWAAGSRVIEAVRAVDTATHPDHQGKGIFRKLTLHGVNELTRRGIGLVFNTPNEKSRPGYLKMGWSTVGRPSLWIAPLNPAAVARVVLSRLRAAQTPARLDRDVTADSGVDFLNTPEFARLLTSVRSAPDKYTTRRDASYIRWRYVACPGSRYRFTSDAAGRALAIHRTRHRSGAREVAICELLFDPARTTAAETARVLRRALKTSRADYGVIAPPSDAREALALGLAGFVPAPRAGPVLTVRPLAGTPSDAPDPFSRRSWAPSAGDIELF